MITLYNKAQVTKEEAEILHRAADILVDVNAKARNWPKKGTELKRILEHSHIKYHTIKEEQP